MARRVLPEFVFLWQQHELLYLTLFSTALNELADKSQLSGDEDAVSEKLCQILRSVCFNFAHSQNKEIRTPSWEPPIPPVSEDELKGGKIRKRPDFTCNCYNSFASSAEEHEISFHIECKLLGNPTSQTWILNKNYVTNGIKRFDSIEHEYGKRATSGLMIGYIIDMSPGTILDEVNNYQKTECPRNHAIAFTFTQEHVNTTHQILNRTTVMPENFKLTHMWADLRHNYQIQKKSTKKRKI
jgi:hypothetical protein